MYLRFIYRYSICRHGRPPPRHRHSPLLKRRRLHPALWNVHSSVFTRDNIILKYIIILYCNLLSTYLCNTHDTVHRRWMQQ